MPSAAEDGSWTSSRRFCLLEYWWPRSRDTSDHQQFSPPPKPGEQQEYAPAVGAASLVLAAGFSAHARRLPRC